MEKISRKIKVLMLVAITIGTMILAGIPSTLAGDSDTFDITVTGQYITLAVDKASWSVNSGVLVAMSRSYYTNATDTFTADSTGSSVNVDVKLQITTDGATWHAATSGNNPAADTYKLNASIDTWSTQVQILTASATIIKTNLAAGQQTFDLKFMSPTSTTTGTQQTITVTASAIAS
jgi:hypothetical protein